jgi:hypothetical protein
MFAVPMATVVLWSLYATRRVPAETSETILSSLRFGHPVTQSKCLTAKGTRIRRQPLRQGD